MIAGYGIAGVCAAIEAALDLGNLWAHADLMAVRGRIGPEAHARVRGLLDDLARALPVTEQRLETYYRSSALRLVFVHAFRPAAHQWPGLLGTARRIGGSGWERWLGPGARGIAEVLREL